MGQWLAWAVGVARTATGVAMLLRTRGAVQQWVGEDGAVPTYLARGIAGRDLAIGLGTVAALRAERDPGQWLLASILGDLADAVAAVGLDEEHATKAAAIAGGFGLLGLAAWATQRS